MSEKKKPEMRTFEAQTLTMPSIKMVLGEVPVPNPMRIAQDWPGKSRSVVRLIDHLDEKKAKK